MLSPQSRSWRVIAEELSQETDPDKTLALAQELSDALLAQHGIEIGDVEREHVPKVSRHRLNAADVV